MLKGKGWLKEHKGAFKDLSKTYKQAKYAVLLLADMGNETIEEFNFVSGTIEEAIVEGNSRSWWPVLLVQEPTEKSKRSFTLSHQLLRLSF